MRACAGVMLVMVVGSAAAQRPGRDTTLAATFAAWATQHRVVGIAAGSIQGDHATMASGGVVRRGGAAPILDNTVFEIGSVTKVFTGTLLAQMVLRGDVALDDPVAKLLPGWIIPDFGGKAITLLDLATQSSGLPRLPTNLAPADPTDPYADYTDAALKQFLAGYKLTRAPGAMYEYSNLAMGLLGRALAAKRGMSYEGLLRKEILVPLGMNDTRVAEDSAWKSREAIGHDSLFSPVHAWHFDALQSAGALRSTMPDMLRFAEALRDTTRGPLARAIAFAVQPRRAIRGADSIGLAWQHSRMNGRDIVWHNGATAGFRTWLSGDLAAKRAVVVTTNGGGTPIDQIGGQLQVGMALGAPTPVEPPAEVAIPASVLAKFVGAYELVPQFSITISQRGDSLFAQGTGQLPFPIFASTQTTFFAKVVKAELLFQVDGSGVVTGLILRQNGADQPARKVR